MKLNFILIQDLKNLQQKKQEKNKIQNSNHRNQQRKHQTEEAHIVLLQFRKKFWQVEFLEN